MEAGIAQPEHPQPPEQYVNDEHIDIGQLDDSPAAASPSAFNPQPLSSAVDSYLIQKEPEQEIISPEPDEIINYMTYMNNLHNSDKLN